MKTILPKNPKYRVTFWAILKNSTIKVKIAVATFWATFEKIGPVKTNKNKMPQKDRFLHPRFYWRLNCLWNLLASPNRKVGLQHTCISTITLVHLTVIKHKMAGLSTIIE